MELTRVPAGHGWQWIKQGYGLFMKSPVLWVVLVVIGIVAALGIDRIPVVGAPLATLLFPVILAGFMLGCRTLEEGEELELAHLFAGFRSHTSHLVTLGGINLVCQLLVLGLMVLAGGATLVGILTAGKPVDEAVIAQAVAEAGFAILLGLTLLTILLMAMQFAPMLVIFRNMAPVDAMKLSLNSFLRNIAPLSVYYGLMLLFALVASMPMMLGWLVLLPVMVTSMYACYTDLFPTAKGTPPQPEASPTDDQPRA